MAIATTLVKVKFINGRIYDSISELPGGMTLMTSDLALQKAFQQEEAQLKEKKTGHWIIELEADGSIVRSFDWLAVKAESIESSDIFRKYRSLPQEDFKAYIESLKERIAQGEKFKTFHFMEGNLNLAKDKDGFYKLESVEHLVLYLNHFFPKKKK